MFLLATSTIALMVGSPPDARAQATVRIVNPGKVSRTEWEKANQSHRKEIVVREKDGTLVLVRLIEYE